MLTLQEKILNMNDVRKPLPNIGELRVRAINGPLIEQLAVNTCKAMKHRYRLLTRFRGTRSQNPQSFSLLFRCYDLRERSFKDIESVTIVSLQLHG